MMQIRKSNDRGLAEHGWLKSYHSFSFAEYYDPQHMGFRSLRVINEDRIAARTGFSAHPHNNMEIISYVISGSLKHEDSSGNKTIIKPGEVQIMSAGSGIVHSEHNAQNDQETHFFQIWIKPDQLGGAPTYQQKSYSEDIASKKIVLVASKNGDHQSLRIKQDAKIYVSQLNQNDQFNYSILPDRGLYLHLIKGHLLINNQSLLQGDALLIEKENEIQIQSKENSEFILFDLA